MIDIWMLFTMIVPFLEVVLHTCTEVMGRPGAPHFPPDGRVHQVQPADHLDQEPRPRVLPAWVGVVGRLLLPILSLLFTTIFWIVGPIASHWPNTKQDSNMSDCLSVEII